VKVLLAHNRYRRPGGEDKHVTVLGTALRETELDVMLFERDSSTVEGSLVRRAGAAVGLAYRPSPNGIRPVLERWRPDIVHFHNIWPLLTPAALHTAKRHGAAVVLTAHNVRAGCPGGVCTIDAHPASRGLYENRCLAGSSLVCAATNNPRGSRVESLVYGASIEVQRRLRLHSRWVDAAIAPSEYAARMLQLVGFRSAQLHVIPNGVRAAAFTPPGRKYGLFAGALSDRKGIRTLLKAASLVPDVPIAVAGNGPLERDVLRARVRFLGHLGSSEVGEAMADSAFVVVPSEVHETLPYVALEAFAAGRAVIASSVGGMPEIVRDGVNGILVPPRSPEALGNSMRKLWTEPDLAVAMGRQGHADIEERFSLERQVQRTLDLYNSLCA
jgi:glycosyltransferase involved in cell wall biosynthesis